MPSTLILTSLAILLAAVLFMFSSNNEWGPEGKHCYITGGSQGLGLSLAILLTKRGAHVSIVARDQSKLSAAMVELEKHRQSPEQILISYSYPLNDATASTAALDAASVPHGGRVPDALFLCAGSAKPGFFVEEDEHSLRSAMDNIYWVQAFTALAAAKRMRGGKLIFVSSLLGYMSLVGYSSYAPAKHALRGLAETLRSELILYGVDVHIFFPGTIYSPGYEQENRTKPKITLQIEESDGGVTPEKAAKALLQGVQRGRFHITADIQSELFRTTARGASPYNNVVLDTIYSFIGLIGLAVWRRSVDSSIKGHREEHRQYLAEKGIL